MTTTQPQQEPSSNGVWRRITRVLLIFVAAAVTLFCVVDLAYDIYEFFVIDRGIDYYRQRPYMLVLCVLCAVVISVMIELWMSRRKGRKSAAVKMKWRAKAILFLAVMACLLLGVYLVMSIKWARLLSPFGVFFLAMVLLLRHLFLRPLKKAKRQYLKKIENRSKLSFEEFAYKHFPDLDSSIVCKVLEEIEVLAEVPMDRLEPTDHLIEDLTLDTWVGLDLMDLLCSIGIAYDVKISVCSLDERSLQLGNFIETIYEEIVKQKKLAVKL